MAAKRRHWKEKGGRFYARIAVPKVLVPILGKTELLKSLGGDLRIADRNHPAAVARLQEEIARNRRIVEDAKTYTGRGCVPVTPADIERAVWAHYTDLLRHDDHVRAAMPTEIEMRDELDRITKSPDVGSRDAIGMINAYTDYR